MHPTTADCLGFIETLCGQEKIRTALDVGTGTGLLAIAAAQMGCERVLAVDLNLLAVKTARENIRLNQMENRVLAVQALAEDFTEIPADLIIANIHYDVMKDLIASRHFLCHPEKNRERWVILSGLLRSQAWMVKDCLIKAGVNIMDQKEQGGIWHTFLGRMG
jgi:ribosomal protein L11 methyltransferase